MLTLVCSLLSQTIFGLKAMRDYTGLGSWIHRDLHPENILYKKGITTLNKPYIRYNVDGDSYYVRHNNYLFVLWDFGKIRQIRQQDEDNFMDVYLDYDHYFLNDWFHLDDLNFFNYEEITDVHTAEHTAEWRSSYVYDIARLLAGIYNKCKDHFHITKRFCKTLFVHFIREINNHENNENTVRVNPIDFIGQIDDILRTDPGLIFYGLPVWRSTFNLDVVDAPPANRVLKIYPRADAGFHFGKSKNSTKKSVRNKSVRKSTKSVRKVKSNKSPKKSKKSVRKSKKSTKSVRKVKSNKSPKKSKKSVRKSTKSTKSIRKSTKSVRKSTKSIHKSTKSTKSPKKYVRR
jgi:hypothetical protein